MSRKLLNRRPPDRSQPLRWAFQAAFLLLNVWIGVEFYLVCAASRSRPALVRGPPVRRASRAGCRSPR